MQKGFGVIYILIGVLILAVAAGAYYLGRSTSSKPSSNPTVTYQTPQPTPIPTSSSTPDETADWKTYTNSRYSFSIKHPDSFTQPMVDNDYGLIGEKIYFAVSKLNPLDCKGDCPLIENDEEVTIAGTKATKMAGYIGEVGGSIPQHFVEYVFSKNGQYISFTLYARDQKDFTRSPNGIWEIEKADMVQFDQILSTFKFL